MSGLLKRLGAGTMTAAVAAAGLIALNAAPAQADPLTVKFRCNVPMFSKQFNWEATVTPTFKGIGPAQEIVVKTSDMPGLAPVPIKNGAIEGTMVLTVDKQEVTATGKGTTSAVADAPVPVMEMTGPYTGNILAPVIAVSKADFIVTASGLKVDVNCTTDPVATFPTPTPTPTPTPSATTPSPTPTESGDKKGVAAKGIANFACKLQTLGSKFTYDPTVSISGSRATADDSKVTLKASFSEIPGLAPVPIENGEMKITAEAMVGGKKVSFASTSKVTVAAYGKVPVPVLTSTMTSTAEKMDVQITAFKFDFGEMSGLTVYSDCTGGGKLSAMTVGIGSVDDDDEGGSGGAGNSSGGSGSGVSGAALPKTGAAALTVIGLWSSAFVLLAVALFLFLPGRRRTEA